MLDRDEEDEGSQGGVKVDEMVVTREITVRRLFVLELERKDVELRLANDVEV